MPDTNLKHHLQHLLAADEPEETVRYLLATTKTEELEHLRQDVLLQSAQLGQWRKLRHANTESFDELVRIRNKASLALLDLVDELPEELPVPELPAEEQPQGVSENRLKDRLFWLLLIAKLVVVVFTFTLWESGSFTNEQFMATVGLLVPVFVTYLALIFKDKVDRRHAITHPDKHVTKGFERTTYLLVFVYAIALLFVINLRGPGVISFNQMNGLLALVESGLGVYVGQVVFALFKRH